MMRLPVSFPVPKILNKTKCNEEKKRNSKLSSCPTDVLFDLGPVNPPLSTAPRVGTLAATHASLSKPATALQYCSHKPPVASTLKTRIQFLHSPKPYFMSSAVP